MTGCKWVPITDRNVKLTYVDVNTDSVWFHFKGDGVDIKAKSEGNGKFAKLDVKGTDPSKCSSPLELFAIEEHVQKLVNDYFSHDAPKEYHHIWNALKGAVGMSLGVFKKIEGKDQYQKFPTVNFCRARSGDSIFGNQFQMTISVDQDGDGIPDPVSFSVRTGICRSIDQASIAFKSLWYALNTTDMEVRLW